MVCIRHGVWFPLAEQGIIKKCHSKRKRVRTTKESKDKWYVSELHTHQLQ